MKVLIMLAVLLCLEGAWAIKCHSCLATNGNTCHNGTVCPAGAAFCISQAITLKMSGQEQTVTRKFCSDSCLNMVPAKSRDHILEGDVSFYCCGTDLCNGAGTSTPGLMLAASVLTVLLGACL
ncbi:lymphocyte antigen 6F-like [Choloepus didactylus]|uniref:lymphocyte antigen 6F-like n=1 Tax=Choloepus didactylus TaxID=27675 RepID=UPI00189E28E0|nr:lymphocyte antigen 6F-like [Choloepus didactylus]